MSVASSPPPLGPLHFKNFPSSAYPTLQGDLSFNASWADITRALLIVGYQNLTKAHAMVGSWRSAMLYSLARGYLAPGLQPTPYYWRLEPTEKVTTSFLLGQGLTYWCAQAHMHVACLVHVADLTSHYVPAPAGAPGKLGPLDLAPRSRPDFLGLGPSRERHVFESKARSHEKGQVNPGSKLVAEALAQACRINRVHNRRPTTSTACVWTLTRAGILGWIEDPLPGPGALELKIDLVWAIRRAYALVLDRASEPKLAGHGDDLAYLDIPGADWRIGVDRKVLELLRELRRNDDERGEAFLELLDHRREMLAELSREPGRTGGPDGIFLVGPPDDDRFQVVERAPTSQGPRRIELG